MQKQPRSPYQIVHAPIPLPDDFPIVGDFHFQQGDRPITWLHGHDCLEIGYCHEGAGIFVIGNKVIPFRSGDVSIISPAEVHLAQSGPGTLSRWDWLYLDPHRLLRMVGKEASGLTVDNLAGKWFRNLIAPGRDAFLGALVREVGLELQERPRDYRTAIRGLVSTLMARLQRLAPRRADTSLASMDSAMRRLTPALDLMAENYALPADISGWARRCHISVTHFRRLFQKALGKSPHGYLTELRIRMAASRLQASDEKIVTIAHEVGFATLSSFNRSFRHLMAVAPREWRRRC